MDFDETERKDEATKYDCRVLVSLFFLLTVRVNILSDPGKIKQNMLNISTSKTFLFVCLFCLFFMVSWLIYYLHVSTHCHLSLIAL